MEQLQSVVNQSNVESCRSSLALLIHTMREICISPMPSSFAFCWAASEATTAASRDRHGIDWVKCDILALGKRSRRVEFEDEITYPDSWDEGLDNW